MKTKLCLLYPNMSFNHDTSASSRTILFLCFPLLFPSILASIYTPDDLLSISCGNSGNISGNERTWTGDQESKFLSEQGESVSTTALTQSPSAPQVPYTTARLSRSKFSYSFPVSAGQKFLRLFFYPAPYPGFDRFNALFTVNSGGFTLLKDFNASVTADASHEDTIFREYCVHVGDGERLNLTFTPNSTHPGSYAFVNGIEIVSMPEDLYYTKPDSFGFKLIGSDGMFISISENVALQLSYRLNVGGGQILETKDTGMLRSWDTDDSFSLGRSAKPTDYQSTRRPLVFSKVPNYTAPVQVYQTERDMGMNKTFNMITNLSWEFPVDSGFTYMLRLHFCELNPDINISYNRMFDIYIADQLAEDKANVLNWAKGKAIPVYRDYAVAVSGDEKPETLSLKMHPVAAWMVEYSDAFLNGLEIFKISDSRNNLAGPNPDPLPPTPPSPNGLNQKHARKTGNKILIGVIVGVAASMVVLVSCITFFIINRGKNSNKSHKSSCGTSKWGPFSFTTTKSASTNASSLPMELSRHFSIAEIRTATNNFDELFNIGVGGFGNVYKGYIDGGLTPVAIKRLKPGSQQGINEFKTEIEMLTQLRHNHLVSLIGYCYESNEMILVYDFMARGTLRNHLYNTDNPALPWKRRLQICIGAARGLHYLHTGAKHMIIHRDVKTTNILIDDKWEAKVSDFGLSRIGPTGIKAHVSTVVKGSIGYLDPEYYKRQHLTEKSDVYSFGVVLFEVLCGRPPIIRIADKRQVLLCDWARNCFHKGALGEVVDPALKGTIATECLKKFGEIGVNCLLDDATQRPTMNDVVWGLEFALQLQESAEKMRGIKEEEEEEEDGGVKEGGGENIKQKNSRGDSDNMFSSNNSDGLVSDFNKSSGVSLTSSTGDHSKDTSRLLLDNSVFSEILDPRAR